MGMRKKEHVTEPMKKYRPYDLGLKKISFECLFILKSWRATANLK